MIIIRDQNRKKLAHLENAYDMGYEFKKNKLAQAQFKLPFNDQKLEYCQPFYLAEFYEEDDTLIDIFRLLPQTKTKNDSTREVAFGCEHALGTLIDDILFRYHEIGGVGVYTTEILQYILERQTTTHWKLGQVDFARQFQYSWEHENLLSALFSIPKPFDQEYLWTWDTTSYPWTLNLIEAPSQVESYIHYKKNLKGIEKETDPKKLVTRVYPLGYGEGINQLGIEEAHPQNKEYIDANTQDQFGAISQVWVDRRYQSAESLYEAAKVWLEERKLPKITYAVNVAELHHITGEDIDKFTVGKVVKVKDEEIGNFHARVVNKRVRDMKGEPGDVDIEIANFDKDIGDAVTNLSTRSRVNETYAQGATNLDSYTFSDNCDPGFPARMRFHISEDAVYINKVLLNLQSLAFRAYSKAIEGGGSIATSTEDGGFASDTTASNDKVSRTETAQAGGSYEETETSSTEEEKVWTDSYIFIPDITYPDETERVEEHSHGLPNHHHGMQADGHSHNLFIDIPTHTHNVGIDIPTHQHSFEVPAHPHDIELPDHPHKIQYGIYEGPSPNDIAVKVDGNEVPDTSTNEKNLNIIPYLEKDEAGKIKRGWHELEIVPNDLGRIEATLHLQVFIQSRGEEKL